MIRVAKCLSLAATAFFAHTAHAHPGHGPHSPLDGPLHPLPEIDYVLIAFAIGAAGVVLFRVLPRRQSQRQSTRG